MNNNNVGHSGARMRTLRKRAKLSQGDIAALCNVSQGTVSNWENETHPIDAKHLMILANRLKVSAKYIMGESDNPHEQAESRISDTSETYNAASESNLDMDATADLSAWDNNTPLDDDEVFLPFFQDIEVAAGAGFVDGGNNGTDRGIRFAKSTLRKSNVPPESAFFISVRGSSMEPLIPDRSTVGINRASTRIIDGEVYAINHGGLYRLKVLYKMPGGQLRIHSYNTEEFPDEFASLDEVEVIGQRFSVQQLFYTG